jgi:16S rRNA (adenine1518-N6/adenine1519-N6)-dimethyltransferase
MSAPTPDSLPPLRDTIRMHGLDAKKALGQHFLLDLNLTRRIVRAAGEIDGHTVIEVGPGPGGLTRALLESPAARIIAIERDARCIAALAELQAAWPGRLSVIEGDALEADWAALAQGPTHVIANLPYNVGTPLLIGWLKQAPLFSNLTLMFQKEVGDRLLTPVGGKAYGRLAVMAQWICKVTRAFDIPARAFTPPPKVDSSVILLTPRAEPLAPARWTAMERVVAAAFGQRRKMLRASLRQLPVDSDALLAAAGIDGSLRAEQLPIADFAALARAFDAAPRR